MERVGASSQPRVTTVIRPLHLSSRTTGWLTGALLAAAGTGATFAVAATLASRGLGLALVAVASVTAGISGSRTSRRLPASATGRRVAVSMAKGLLVGLASFIMAYLLASTVAFLIILAWHPTW
jgi:hypothetical protein